MMAKSLHPDPGSQDKSLVPDAVDRLGSLYADPQEQGYPVKAALFAPVIDKWCRASR